MQHDDVLSRANQLCSSQPPTSHFLHPFPALHRSQMPFSRIEDYGHEFHFPAPTDAEASKASCGSIVPLQPTNTRSNKTARIRMRAGIEGGVPNAAWYFILPTISETVLVTVSLAWPAVPSRCHLVEMTPSWPVLEQWRRRRGAAWAICFYP